MNSHNRRVMMLAVIAVLGVLFIADMFGALPGRAEENVSDDLAPSPRAVYLARAQLAGEQEALIAQKDQWKSAAAQANREWGLARRQMVAERTMELAEARFRDRTLDALKDLNLTAARVTPVRDRTPETGGAKPLVAVRGLTMEVRFDATSQHEVYAAIDRLESMSDITTQIASLRMDGPGRLQMPRMITVVLTLQAQAVVGEEAANRG